jgi:FkbM family methyltransferase
MHKLIPTLRFVTGHPLTRDDKFAAIARFVRWQLESRLGGEVVVPWIEGTKLAVRRGLTGATGNIYCGLHEFSEMAFLLHFLREDDTFFDVGANVGSFTVLASGVVGARSWAFEPDPETLGYLARNVEINGLRGKVLICPFAVGDTAGDILFTVGRDTVNKIANADDLETRLVRQKSLDDVSAGIKPAMIKLDVEGYEACVLRGAAKTLAEPGLKAIETEGLSDEIVATLRLAGFQRVFYDPFSRVLSNEPRRRRDNNALFVRDLGYVEHRLRTARRVSVLRHEL